MKKWGIVRQSDKKMEFVTPRNIVFILGRLGHEGGPGVDITR